MDHSVQRPVPSYANFSYDRKNYASILKEILNPLGLQLKQGKWIDAIVLMPPPSPVREGISPRSPLVPPTPLVGVLGAPGEASSDSLAVQAVLEALEDLESPEEPRHFRAKASGLLKSSARKMGVSYTELLQSPSPADANTGKLLFFSSGNAGEIASSVGRPGRLWEISAKASDSLGSLDFARIVDFYAFDKARVVFGGETRRVDSQINYESGSAVTQYSSIFDGLTVDVNGDRWFFIWRGNGSVLEVPGSVGSCASGSSKVSYNSTVGVPLLSRIPVLKYLFSYEDKYDDELLIEVCLEDLT